MDLAERAVSGKAVCNKAFTTAKKRKYDGYQRGFTVGVIKSKIILKNKKYTYLLKTIFGQLM